MNKINVMSESLANKIAAGEVVERIGNVVKELVENSIDAGSKNIKVELLLSGTKLIKIVDDGCGMSKDDAMLCFSRHATSKIKNENAPLPFNLAKLQAYCSQKYGYSAQQTQDITQVLKDKHKLITYNRSDSQYLNEEHFTEAPEKLQVIFKNLNIKQKLKPHES